MTLSETGLQAALTTAPLLEKNGMLPSFAMVVQENRLVQTLFVVVEATPSTTLNTTLITFELPRHRDGASLRLHVSADEPSRMSRLKQPTTAPLAAKSAISAFTPRGLLELSSSDATIQTVVCQERPRQRESNMKWNTKRRCRTETHNTKSKRIKNVDDIG